MKWYNFVVRNIGAIGRLCSRLDEGLLGAPVGLPTTEVLNYLVSYQIGQPRQLGHWLAIFSARDMGRHFYNWTCLILVSVLSFVCCCALWKQNKPWVYHIETSMTYSQLSPLHKLLITWYNKGAYPNECAYLKLTQIRVLHSVFV